MAETVTTNSGVDLPVLVKQSEDLSAENAALKARLSQAVMFKDSLHFQQYIEAPPVPKEALYGRACSGDSITTASWFQMWIDHTRYNDGKYHFAENSAMQ
jgi:hypothetical protein